MMGIEGGLPLLAVVLRRLTAVAGNESPRSTLGSLSSSSAGADAGGSPGDRPPSLVAGLTWADTVDITRITP
jgi:hypothetical protein